MIPQGSTHFAEFYGDITFYKNSQGTHFNQVIDHPIECWQKYDIWHYWENGQWVAVGSGFSSRRCKAIEEFECV